MDSERDLYKKAEKRVKQKKGFFVHLSVYISVGIFFFVMNMVTDPYETWFFFPLMPWGVGLLIHYFTTFGFPGSNILSDDWEREELEKEIERLQAMKRLKNRKEGLDLEPEETQDDQLDLDDLPKVKQKQKTRRWDDQDLV